MEYLSPKTQIWSKNIGLTKGTLDSFFDKAIISFEELKDSPLKHLSPQQLFINAKSFTKQIDCFPVIEFGQAFHYIADGTYEFSATPQPTFNKQFDLLASDLHKGQENDYQNSSFVQLVNKWIAFKRFLKTLDKKLNSLL